MAKTIIITGTHHTPAQELIRQLKKDSIRWNIYYLSHLYPTETHLRNSIIPLLESGHFFSLDCGKFNRRSLSQTLLNFPKTILAIFRSLKIITTLKPNIIVSFGGYVSVPVVIASWLCRCPSITHEQTPTISLSTKINSIFATKVALSFPSTFSPKTVLTGNLLRSEIFQTSSSKFTTKLKPFIYITGGNQGSEFLNLLTLSLLPVLCRHHTIIHQTGKKKTKPYNSPKYIHQNYTHSADIGFLLNQADLIISRSGANICQEIVAIQKKSILIPLPHSQQNEQLLNAKWVKTHLPRHTIILDQTQATPKKLLLAISRLSQIKPLPRPPVFPSNLKLLNLIHELV